MEINPLHVTNLPHLDPGPRDGGRLQGGVGTVALRSVTVMTPWSTSPRVGNLEFAFAVGTCDTVLNLPEIFRCAGDLYGFL